MAFCQSRIPSHRIADRGQQALRLPERRNRRSPQACRWSGPTRGRHNTRSTVATADHLHTTICCASALLHLRLLLWLLFWVYVHQSCEPLCSAKGSNYVIWLRATLGESCAACRTRQRHHAVSSSCDFAKGNDQSTAGHVVRSFCCCCLFFNASAHYSSAATFLNGNASRPGIEAKLVVDGAIELFAYDHDVDELLHTMSRVLRAL